MHHFVHSLFQHIQRHFRSKKVLTGDVHGSQLPYLASHQNPYNTTSESLSAPTLYFTINHSCFHVSNRPVHGFTSQLTKTLVGAEILKIALACLVVPRYEGFLFGESAWRNGNPVHGRLIEMEVVTGEVSIGPAKGLGGIET